MELARRAGLRRPRRHAAARAGSRPTLPTASSSGSVRPRATCTTASGSSSSARPTGRRRSCAPARSSRRPRTRRSGRRRCGSSPTGSTCRGRRSRGSRRAGAGAGAVGRAEPPQAARGGRPARARRARGRRRASRSSSPRSRRSRRSTSTTRSTGASASVARRGRRPRTRSSSRCARSSTPAPTGSDRRADRQGAAAAAARAEAAARAPGRPTSRVRPSCRRTSRRCGRRSRSSREPVRGRRSQALGRTRAVRVAVLARAASDRRALLAAPAVAHEPRDTGFPLCYLTTTGRRTGEPRTVPLLHVADGERVVLIASNWGRPASSGLGAQPRGAPRRACRSTASSGSARRATADEEPATGAGGRVPGLRRLPAAHRTRDPGVRARARLTFAQESVDSWAIEHPRGLRRQLPGPRALPNTPAHGPDRGGAPLAAAVPAPRSLGHAPGSASAA